MISPSMMQVVSLDAVLQTKISNVNVYSGLAEVARTCRTNLQHGDNKVVISGLPNVMLKESLRVEGHGPCTIHEVTIAETPRKTVTITTSEKLVELRAEKARLEKARKRCQLSIDAVDSYQKTLTAPHISSNDLGASQHNILSILEELHDKILQLEEKIEGVNKSIEEELVTIGATRKFSKLMQQVSITLSAEKDTELELVLLYGVSEATWDAIYDIYVDMNAKENPATVVYKASITQNTGEDWSDVPLTLETVTPIFSANIPRLQPWTISTFRPITAGTFGKKQKMSSGFRPAGMDYVARSSSSASRSSRSLSFDDKPRGRLVRRKSSDAPMPNRGLVVSSKGDINATFTIPGLLTVPSDGASHKVTITTLHLDAQMSWVTVPKISLKSHLNAKIKNASEYTFINGLSSVYVDGSFISRSSVPLVSPEESFDCALGVDPSIRVIYHPQTKKVTRSGFTKKMNGYVFEQRITVLNTKSSAIKDVKVQDQVPVSEDSTISVNLISPRLIVPEPSKRGKSTAPGPVNLGGGVVAQWEGTDEPETDPELLGKDGKLSWICSIPAQGKIHLLLSWEVACPSGSNIYGLN